MSTSKTLVIHSHRSTALDTFRNPTLVIPNVFPKVPSSVKVVSCSIPKNSDYISTVGSQNNALKVSTDGTTWTTVTVPPSPQTDVIDFDGSADYISGTLTTPADDDFTITAWVRDDTSSGEHAVIDYNLSGTNSVFKVSNYVATAVSIDFTSPAYIRADTAVDFASTGTTIFAIESWYYYDGTPTSNAIIAFNAIVDGSNQLLLVVSGTEFNLYINNALGITVTYSTAGVGASGEWVSYAITYDGTDLRFYINGTLRGTSTTTMTVPLADCSFALGTEADNANFTTLGNYFSGYMNSCRISSVARQTGSSYTPSTTALATDANTEFLWGVDGNYTTDDSGNSHVITTSGTLASITSSPFSGSVDTLGLTTYNGSENVSYTSSAVFSATGWKHIAIVKSGTDATFYADGTAIGDTGSVHATLASSVSNNFYIGSTAGSTEFWNGSIRDVRIYYTALSASSINEVYADTYTATTATHHWKMDEGSGATATIIDTGSAGDDGTGVSLTWTTDKFAEYTNAQVATSIQNVLNYQASALSITFTCTWGSDKFTIGGDSNFYLSFDVANSIGNLLGWSNIIADASVGTSFASKRTVIDFSTYDPTNDEDYIIIASNDLIKGRDAGVIGLDNHFNTQESIAHIPYSNCNNYTAPNQDPFETISYSDFLSTLVPSFETKSTTVSTQFELKLSSGLNIRALSTYQWTAKIVFKCG